MDKSNASEATQASNVVLVTGSNGLVGMAVRDEVSSGKPLEDCSPRWFFASSKDADLRDLHATWALFERVQPTHVLHLAAHVGGLFANMKNQVEFWRDNNSMQDNIFQCCKEFKVKRLVSCLSTCIFPDRAPLPMDESMIMTGPPHFSNRGYAYAKRMALMLGELYNEQYDTNFATVVPCNVFGEHDNFSIEGGHVLPGLMHKCYLAKREKTPFVVWGSGKPLRQFIYSKDLARLLLWHLLQSTETDPIILAPDPDEEISIAKAAEMVAAAMNFKGEIVFDRAKEDGQHKKTCSNSKLRSLQPKFRFTPTTDAIKKTATWFQENYAASRK
jgi:GDP-L-fucose synthase